jgi:phospholipid/cholesterol/gamma-HCH transport system substrate-binding protein
MGRNIVETIVGGLVLVVAASFLFQLLGAADVTANQDGYELEARFLRAGGLQSGADVRVSGIKVGTVLSHKLDQQSFEAVMVLAIDSDIRLPSDSKAIITGDGLLGGKYLRLEPGVEETMLEDGARFTNVVDFESIEDLVGRVLFLAAN